MSLHHSECQCIVCHERQPPADETVATTEDAIAMRPLFVPLKTAYYEAFLDGSKTTEYRQYGPRWNERTCIVGRRVTISKGYGRRHRRQGTVVGFRKQHMRSRDWLACYGNPGLAACIAIKLDDYCHGDTCPECKTCKLDYDRGHDESRDEPGHPAVVFCQDCGTEFPVDVDRVMRRNLAEQITTDLFTNAFGSIADRLVMELPDGRSGGGWCRAAVIDRVAKALDSATVTGQ